MELVEIEIVSSRLDIIRNSDLGKFLKVISIRLHRMGSARSLPARSPAVHRPRFLMVNSYVVKSSWQLRQFRVSSSSVTRRTEMGQ